jgi:hypothetical protein
MFFFLKTVKGFQGSAGLLAIAVVTILVSSIRGSNAFMQADLYYVRGIKKRLA